MKKLMTVLFLVIAAQSAHAGVTYEQQQEALSQLQIAKSEIRSIRSLIPRPLQGSIGRNLKNAEERITYAERILAGSSVGSRYYCVVESSFDGQFSGTGSTRLEASNNAQRACRAGSRNNGFFCKNEATCEQQ